MDIEKINENQVKFVLNKFDLQMRNIKLTELAYGNEKTQKLFKDILSEAFEKFDFDVENTPLMIEAIPVAPDSIIIFVSKVDNPSAIEERFTSFTPKQLEKKDRQSKKDTNKKSNTNNYFVLIYSFDSLSQITDISKRLKSLYVGDSSVYKLNSRFYLVLDKLENQNQNKKLLSHLELILLEYGHKHISNNISKYYLIEHGEVLIKANALNILYTYLA